VILLEGSGTALPPVASDATLYVVSGGVSEHAATGALAPLRLLLADLVTITMAEEPTVSAHALSALSSSINDLARGVAQVKTVFRPAPRGPVTGRSVFYATTAPHNVGEVLRAHLEGAHGARVVGISHHLANRSALERDMDEAEGSYEVLVTELKAGAVDVATRRALGTGAEVIFADNLPISTEGDLEAEVVRLAERAQRRFEAHTDRTT